MQWQPKQLTTMVNELQNQREANDTSTSLDLRNKFHRNLHVHERKRGKKQILGEIIGATNLAAALRKKSQEGIMQEQYSEHSEKPSISPVYDSFCEVYWDGKVIHRTKTVYKRYERNMIFLKSRKSIYTTRFYMRVTHFPI
jgi:hypothetical protein